MKLLKQDFKKGSNAGYVKLLPEEADDLWNVYNLIDKGDLVFSTTVRKVPKGNSSHTDSGEGLRKRKNNSMRVRMKLGVEVENVDYDNIAAVLHVRGRNIVENEHVKLGVYHTLEIVQNRSLSIQKAVWDSFARETLKQACHAGASADLAALMMQEGLANLCLVGSSITTVKARVETSIPRKRGQAIAGYDKTLAQFFKNVLRAVVLHVDFVVVRCLIIASPGFTKDQFYEYMLLEAASRQDLRAVIENKSKIVLCHASSGYKHDLKELLASPAITMQVKDIKATKDVKVLEDFYKILSSEPSRAFYGPRHVEAANEQGAVQTLLISDELFKNSDVVTRRKYVTLVKSVKKKGGVAHVFSSRHVSGEQLGQLTGIAAILRFPLPDLEDMEL